MKMKFAAKFGLPIITLIDTPKPIRASAPEEPLARPN